MSLPLVSHFAICYNHERYVTAALESIRNQTYPNLELIIVDDSSTDHSADLIEGWIASHKISCTFIKHNSNSGLVSSLNECLRLAKGEFISFMALDDNLKPTKIETLVNLLNTNPIEVGLAYGDLEVIDQDSRVTHSSYYEWHLGMPPPNGNAFSSYFDRNPVHFLGAVVRRRTYDVIGEFDESLTYEDWDMGMRMARNFKFVYEPVVVASYRKFSGQMTDIYWSDPEKRAMILMSDFRMFSKHLDYQLYRKQIVRKMSSLYAQMIDLQSISWRQKVSMSFQIFVNSPSLKYLLMFLVSIFNNSKFANNAYRAVVRKFSTL